MKNTFLTLAFMLIASFAFANANNTTIDEEAAIDKISVDEDAACWIVNITVSCGGTYKTQYCDGGSHGTLGEWIMQVDSWACDEE